MIVLAMRGINIRISVENVVYSPIDIKSDKQNLSEQEWTLSHDLVQQEFLLFYNLTELIYSDKFLNTA